MAKVFGDHIDLSLEDVQDDDLVSLCDRIVMKVAIKRGARPDMVRESDQYADGWIGATKAVHGFKSGMIPLKVWLTLYVDRTIRRGFRVARSRVAREIPDSVMSGDYDLAYRSWIAEIATDSRWEDERDQIDAVDAVDCLFALVVRDDRTRRLVERVVMGEWTMDEAGRSEEERGRMKPISRQRVHQIVSVAVEGMRAKRERVMGDD